MKKSVLLLKTTSALAAAGAAACLAVPLLLQLSLGFTLHSINKGAVAVIGGADGPTSIFLASKLGQTAIMGPIAVAACWRRGPPRFGCWDAPSGRSRDSSSLHKK